jgi:isoleucyl-tRNA synthetase
VWLPKPFDPQAVPEVATAFLNRLRNTYGFFAQYAGLEGWGPTAEAPAAAERPALDRWILARLDRLAEECGRDLEAFDVTHAARRIAEFAVDDLSNWYVRRSRPRFWGTRGADPAGMRAAFATLEECLAVVSGLLAPFAPFLSDWIHRELTGGRSVHLADYPVPRGRLDPGLEEGMAAVRRLAALGHAVRDSVKVRVRQPLRRLRAAVPAGVRARLGPELRAILAEELNVKEVEVGEEIGALVQLRAVPNFRHLGPAFGAKAPAVAEALRAVGSEALERWRAEGGPLAVEVEGESVRLDPDAFALQEEAVEGLAVRADAGYAVAIDPALDEALLREGAARELVNRIQRLRKDAGLRVEDRIRLGIFGPPELAEAARAHREYIAAETLAVEVEIGSEAPEAEGRYRCFREVQVNGAGGRIALTEVGNGKRPTTRRPSSR